MFYANLRSVDDKVSYYMMHKHIVIDSEILAKQFKTDASPRLTIGSFPDYKKELAIEMLFPYQTPKDVSGKIMITSLSSKDRILHFGICKVLFPQAIKSQIIDYELFYMWAIKKQANFNFPFLIMKYLYDCSLRKDIRYLPYNLILTPFF